ncbi:DUF3810 domain-containing protein [Soonwooa sp.]|uniref:DUF3810 domain-containing protein n=1 Tax=Soonwooa sp. TaxID=1938592 RepID=UPI002637A318|nr:DUF3810 domain-containing protein [Soonwooa sp.]
MKQAHTKSSINKKILIWAGLWFAQIFVFYLFSKSDTIIKAFGDFYDLQKSIHQKIFAWSNFSVGDIFYIILSLWLIFTLYLSFKKGLKSQITKILIFVNIIYFTYQILWGMMYFQKPIIKVNPDDKIPIEKLKALSVKYLKACIALRENLPEDENGIYEIKNIESIKKSIIESQSQIPLKFNTKPTTKVIDIKPSLYGKVMSLTGILGYYNPFTAEAQYDANVPDNNKAFTLSHEAAHQLGYAREQEASFIGFLSCIHSNDKDLEYSAKLYALKNILGSIQQSDPKWVNQILSQYSPKMKKDRENEIAFRQKNESWLGDFFGWTNDLFLKSNRQDGSITYSYFIYLLLYYEA